MKRKVKISEVILLLFPVVFLAVTGLTLRGRIVSAPENNLSVKEIIFRRLPDSGELSGRVGITIFVQYVGREPTWWKNSIGDQRVQNMRFVNQRGKEYPLYSYGISPAPYDAARKSHVQECTATIPTGYKIAEPGYFKGTVVIKDQASPPILLGLARFSIPVKAR